MTEQPYQTKPSRQLELPLDHAPAAVRGHGLRAAHTAPRVGHEIPAGAFWSGRVPAEFAWAYPYIALQDAGTKWATITLDCDDREAMAAGLADLPPYNWLVRTARGGHATWCLAAPVAKHGQARRAPETYLARVGEYYAAATSADPDFSGLGRNPSHPRADTIWGRTEPYSLDGLANVIPFGWKRPRVPQTGIGRNRAMFEAGMMWAGSPANQGLAVLTALHSVRDEVCGAFAGDHPYTLAEMAATARFIEKLRDAWERGGWHKPAWIEKQRRVAGIGGEKRRAATADRDAGIVEAVAAGQSMRAVAREHGLAESTVRRLIERDAPLFASAHTNTLSKARPWEAEGVSRATWFRRRQTPATKLNSGS